MHQYSGLGDYFPVAFWIPWLCSAFSGYNTNFPVTGVLFPVVFWIPWLEGVLAR